MDCAQCHSHTYDPITHEEFYQVMAIFNNTADKDLYNEQPKLFTHKPEDKEAVSSLIAWLEEKTGSDTVATAINDERFLYREQESLLTQICYSSEDRHVGKESVSK